MAYWKASLEAEYSFSDKADALVTMLLEYAFVDANYSRVRHLSPHVLDRCNDYLAALRDEFA